VEGHELEHLGVRIGGDLEGGGVAGVHHVNSIPRLETICTPRTIIF
jgi:hypothetical protein